MISFALCILLLLQGCCILQSMTASQVLQQQHAFPTRQACCQLTHILQHQQAQQLGSLKPHAASVWLQSEHALEACPSEAGLEI